MPADLMPKEAIAGIAAKGMAAELLRMLQRVGRERFIFNDVELDGKERAALEELADLGLVDPGYEGPPTEKPAM